MEAIWAEKLSKKIGGSFIECYISEITGEQNIRIYANTFFSWDIKNIQRACKRHNADFVCISYCKLEKSCYALISMK